FSMAASPRVRTAKALRSKRCSEKQELRARRRRPSEGPGLERRQAPVEPVLLGRHREQRRDLLRVLALPALASAERRVAEAPAARAGRRAAPCAAPAPGRVSSLRTGRAPRRAARAL